ncbi:lytic polysaccharide monooxygenase auxiliary activity family 9 protein [Nocardia bovistercoris]|uniref:Lytic polysaccharide monooxygenase n=1 Tax=Nocardia bovistercoris TaxID=2785916 RepID=A0A931IAH1_9NOCA|nr:lytic polysaccharide monooxygenase auxiliary activity family 9 protein [Nocardia bovistercoris]MBH0777759.1 lytic polysaccharide monooxygenase [Nocardia bovistercoris]
MSGSRSTTPSDLRGEGAFRDDGKHTMYGIDLRWQIGRNAPDQGAWPPPEDWNEGNAPYPHIYEVWIDDEVRQTVFLYWPAWDWTPSNSHWVDLGEDPDAVHSVKIRAKVDGQYTAFSNEVTVDLKRAAEWSGPERPRDGLGRLDAAPRHGTMNHPRSRAAAAIRDQDPASICAEARRQNTSTTWQEVLPGAERMLADYPWNYANKYLEYRKFFENGTVASTGNPAFRGLDLAPNASLGEWPLTELDTSAATQTFTYDYTAYHTNETWSHRWFITRPGWDPANGLGWHDLEPIPFLVEIQGSHHEAESSAWEFASFPRRTGRAAIVHIWGGHGGPDTPDGGNGGKTGEFFASTCDVMLR